MEEPAVYPINLRNQQEPAPHTRAKATAQVGQRELRAETEPAGSRGRVVLRVANDTKTAARNAATANIPLPTARSNRWESAVEADASRRSG